MTMFEHDCKRCTFRGHDPEQHADIYTCNNTVLARYSDTASDYCTFFRPFPDWLHPYIKDWVPEPSRTSIPFKWAAHIAQIRTEILCDSDFDLTPNVRKAMAYLDLAELEMKNV